MTDLPPSADLLNVEEAAKRLRLSKSTLDKARREGAGPPFVRLGRRVLYTTHDLDAWIAANRRQVIALGAAHD